MNGQALTGNVTITSATAGTLNISAGTITGNLTVDAANATVNNAATVSGTITINNVSGNTWNENASNNNIVFNDPNAGTNLVIGAGQTVSSLTLNTPAKVSVSTGATVTALTVEAGAANTAISNSGTITTVTANGNTSLTGTAPSTVNGTGTVSGSALAAPANGAVTKSGLVNVTEAGAKFLAFGLQEGSREVPSTLADVKTYIDTKYGVNFNTDAIKVVNGQITIDGTILTTADWNKVKTNGNKAVPYRITLVQDGATAADASAKRVIKIAMYQDGKAVLNTVDNTLITK